jgi:hypothetical protein
MPSIFESIVTPITLDLEIEVAYELLKIQLTLNYKSWIFHHMFYPPLHFLVVNNNNKPNPINVQNMHCVICHYVPICIVLTIPLRNKKV